jgi:hypothetical protein
MTTTPEPLTGSAYFDALAAADRAAAEAAWQAKSASQRLASLFEAWQEHCWGMPAERHKPATEGGKARYEANDDSTRIVCTYRGCTWALQVAVEAPTSPRFTVEPVGRARGRRLGGISSGIVRREGREPAKKRSAEHHIDRDVDPWLGAVTGAEQS